MIKRLQGAVREGVILCLPGLWVVMTSFRPNVEVLARPTVWLPQNPTLDNYLKIFGLLPQLQAGLPVAQYFTNSLVISVTSTAIAILIGMMGGYAFARYRFRGKAGLFVGFMLTRSVPGIAHSLPLFIVWSRIGLIDTPLGLIIVYLAINIPFTIWLTDGFFRQIPVDLNEAAQIDGCTRWQAFWKVEFPLARAGLASAAIFAYALYPHMTVRENLGFGLKIAKQSETEIKKRVDEAAEILGLHDYMDRLPQHLSGGQRQRVAMGRAIVRNPDVFLFDEPLSNLDAKLRGQMRVEIKKLHQRVQTTVIYVTHDQVEAMTLADRIVIMRDGHIEQVGTPSEVFDRPANVFVAGFNGSPPMNQLDAEIGAEGGRPVARLADGLSIPVPADIVGNATAGQKVVVGFRPESLAPRGHALDSAGKSVALTRPVVIAEPLGTETILYTEMAGREVQGRMLNPRPVKPGEVLDFVLDLSRLHLFDKASGKSLRG